MRNVIRSITLFVLFGGIALFATSAGAAQNYLMTGKFAVSMGAFIDIPVIGDNPGGVRNCGSTTMSAVTMMGTMTGAMNPGMSPIRQGWRTDYDFTGKKTPAITMTKFANNRGCISVAGKFAATAPGAGKAFTLPTMAFNHPLPGKTVAVEIPTPPIAIQLATSFAVTGPPLKLGLNTPMDKLRPNGTMNNGANTAKFRFFHASAWKTQTGRAGPTFTWCFGNPNCTKAAQAKGYPNTAVDPIHQLIVKYKNSNPNRFGGTMSFVIGSGPHPASLAVSIAGRVQFLGLAGDGGHAETGRGYAEYGTAPLMGGKAFLSFMVGKVFVPQIMSYQNLITKLGPGGVGYPSAATVTKNKNFGFPFTTGTVLVRNTGTSLQKNPAAVTLTGMGGDVITAMGARNISLVAGAVAGIDFLSSETPNMSQLFLPEPAAPVQLIAGIAAMLGIAVWRSRKVR